MGPDEGQVAESRTLRNTLAETQTKPSSELERCFMMLDKQNHLLEQLDMRLDSVMHRNPTDAKEAGHDRAPHISMVADGISANNRKISILLEQLAI